MANAGPLLLAVVIRSCQDPVIALTAKLPSACAGNLTKSAQWLWQAGGAGPCSPRPLTVPQRLTHRCMRLAPALLAPLRHRGRAAGCLTSTCCPRFTSGMKPFSVIHLLRRG
jgi:hypothetical protein